MRKMGEEIVSTSDLLKVTIAALFGAWAEVYDFVVAGPISSIAWPHVFFPEINPALATAAGISTFLVSFAVRPVGGWLFGHMGDRLGRRSSVVWTLFTAGIGTLIIVLLPGYSAIGILAPAILIVARVLVGLGFGGEFGSTSTWVLEQAAHRKRRGFWTALLGQGYTLGPLTAAGVVTATLSSVGLKAFIDFWWRVPFMIALVVLVIGIVIRYELMESPIFRKIYSAGKIVSAPISKLFREMPGRWLLVTLTAMSTQIGFYAGNTIMVPYIEHVLKLPASFATFTFLTGEILGVVVAIIAALTVDVIGRKRLLAIMIGILLTFAIPYGYLMSTGMPKYVLIAQTIIMGVASGGIPPVLTSFASESFPPQYRVTGTGLAWQFSIIFGTLPESYLMLYLMGFGRIGAIYISLVVLVVEAISLGALLALKETKGISIE